jgi:hypothetical protein
MTSQIDSALLQYFSLLRANDDGFLAEQLFQTPTVTSPPADIEGRVHHFVNDDFFAFCFFSGSPMSFSGCSAVSSQAAESFGKFALDCYEMFSGQRAALIIGQGQQNLD